MAPIPKSATQPTVDAIYRAYERDADTQNRPHLGASVIGRECARALWYSFRWATAVTHSGRLLRLFERGQREEAVFVANLRAVGIEVLEVDPRTGRQFHFSAHGGHFGGSMDAAALGIVEAPKTWHVCEFKTSSNKLFQELKAKGVEHAKPEHAAQMQCYMHATGMTCAFYLSANKDTDELYSERLRYDPARAAGLFDKARRIIIAGKPPARLSNMPDFFLCRWCDHHAICHEGKLPEVNCRTCFHATPEIDGTDGAWSCAHYDCVIAIDYQRAGSQCPAHRYIPALLPWLAMDASEEGNWIEYQGGIRNGGGGMTSVEMKEAA